MMSSFLIPFASYINASLAIMLCYKLIVNFALSFTADHSLRMRN